MKKTLNYGLGEISQEEMKAINGGAIGISEEVGVGLFVLGTVGGIVASAANPLAGAAIIMGTWGIVCNEGGH